MWRYLLLMFVISLFLVASQIFLKFSLQGIGPVLGVRQFIVSQFIPMVTSWTFLGMVTSTLGAFILWIYVLGRVQITLVYPMISFSYIIMAFVGTVAFKEPLTLNKIIGTVIICLGIFLLLLDKNW